MLRVHACCRSDSLCSSPGVTPGRHLCDRCIGGRGVRR
jgi:hypothetical protein